MNNYNPFRLTRSEQADTPPADLGQLSENRTFLGRHWTSISNTSIGWQDLVGAVSLAAQVPSNVAFSAANMAFSAVSSVGSVGRSVSHLLLWPLTKSTPNFIESSCVEELFENIVLPVESVSIFKMKDAVEIDSKALANLFKGIEINNDPIKITNGIQEEISVPLQFSRDVFRTRIYDDAKLVADLSAMNHEELMFEFCKNKQNRYGTIAFNNYAVMLTQSVTRDACEKVVETISHKMISQVTGSRSVNIWENEDGEMHAKHSIIFQVHKDEDPTHIESFIMATIEIIISRAEINQKWSPDSEGAPSISAKTLLKPLSIKDILVLPKQQKPLNLARAEEQSAGAAEAEAQPARENQFAITRNPQTGSLVEEGVEAKDAIAELIKNISGPVKSSSIAGEVSDPSNISQLFMKACDPKELVEMSNSTENKTILVPRQFSIDAPRLTYYLNETLATRRSGSEDEQKDALFDFCQNLQTQYEEIGFRRIAALLVQSSLSDLAIFAKKALESEGSFSGVQNSANWNIWEDNEQNIHLKFSVTFKIRDENNPEEIKSFIEAKREIIIPRSEINKEWMEDSKENPLLTVSDVALPLSIDEVLRKQGYPN
jgi:hypothetical protein